MLDQKEIVRAIYVDLVSDESWIVKYKQDPDEVLSAYGVSEENREYLKKILRLF